MVEPKLHGCRVLIHLRTGTVWNRHLEPFTKTGCELAVQKTIAKMQPFVHATDDDGNPIVEWIDAEALTGHGLSLGAGSIVIIDVDAPGNLLERRRYFDHIQKFPLSGSVWQNSCYAMPRHPLRKADWLWDSLSKRDRLYEGVVRKKISHIYRHEMRPNRETNGWVKHRF